MNYPNLSFEMDRLEFGCVLSGQMSRRHLGVTNCSRVPAVLSWQLEECSPGLDLPL